MSKNNLSQSIFRKAKQEDRYAQISNELINDRHLSYKALGIATYILSKPDDWQVYISDLVRDGKDGEKSVRSGINELIDNNYMQRYRVFDMDTGKVHHWETLVSEERFTEQKLISYVKEKYLKNDEGNIIMKKITIGNFTREIPIVLEREEILLSQKGKVVESEEDQHPELLSQNVQVENLQVEKEGQLILTNTNTDFKPKTDISSSSQEDKEEDLLYSEIINEIELAGYNVTEQQIKKLFNLYGTLKTMKAINTSLSVNTEIKNFYAYVNKALQDMESKKVVNITIEKNGVNQDNFNNFEQRKYDYKQLEEELLNAPYMDFPDMGE